MNVAQLEKTGELAAALRPVDASYEDPSADPRPSQLTPGLHFGYPESKYHARESGVASKSALDLVARAPSVYRAWLDGKEPEPTDAMLFGSAFHCAVLEPERFVRAYAAQPDFGDCRLKGPKANRDAWRASVVGKTILSYEDAVAIAGMRAAILAHPLFGRLIGEGHTETTGVSHDASTGLIRKCRSDLWHPGMRVLADLKSTANATASEFAKSCAQFGYHRQQAFYEDIFAECGQAAEAFLFFAIEKTSPYLCAVYQLESRDVARGRATNLRLLTTLAECTANDTWPGLPDGITRISLPRWAA